MENFVQFYLSMPPVTRVYISACVLTTLGVQLDLISPFQLYFNFKLIFYQHQYWRLITTFLFFGTLSFSFFFNILFLSRYSRMLEEGSFRSNSADYFFMLLFGAALMIAVAPFVKLLFLGHAFTIMLVYLWSKRNPAVQLSLFGLFNFRAPHLPWVLLAFSLILGNSVMTDVMGISIGHIYYYLQDVFPHLPGGFRILKTPRILVYLFNPGQYYLDRLESQVIIINSMANSAANATENVQTNGPTTNRPTAAAADSQAGASNATTTPEAERDTAKSATSTTNESKDNQELRNRAEKSENKLTDRPAESTTQPTGNAEKKEQSNLAAKQEQRPAAHEHLD